MCLLALPPVSASWSNTLNNGDLALYPYTSGYGGSYGYSTFPGYSDTANVYTYGYSSYLGSGLGYWVTPNASGTSNYYAYTRQSTSNNPTSFALFDSSRTLIYGYSYDSEVAAANVMHRVEILRSGTAIYTYLDGTLNKTYTGVSGTSVYAFGFGSITEIAWGGINGYFDDLSFGDSPSTTALISVMPHSWYIKSDMIDPSNFAMINSAGDQVYADHFNVQWSLGAYADGWQASQNPPNNRYRIAITGADQYVVYNEYINITAAGAATGIISIPMNQTYIGNSPLSYGQYLVRLYDGSAVKSTDYFYVIGTGATIAWGNPTYTIGSTAAITYSISSSYYDTATYTYKIEIIDIYGNIQKTQTINGQAGSISVSLDSSTYSDGVYYAEIIATPKSGGSDIAMNYAATEINSYITLSGYVMNAETGATLSGATVNVSQLSTSLVSTSDVNGSYSNNNNWLSGSEINITTNLTGYTTDVNVFTPLTADAITLNISLIPSPPTYSGIAIGGIVRDNQYHNVIPSATVYKITNVSRTGSGSATTNIAGYYRFDSLVNGTVYDIWSSKTGFANSTVEQKLAVGT